MPTIEEIANRTGGLPIKHHAASLDSRELATVLAGLRFWQIREAPYSIQQIATDGGTLERMSNLEIDALCEWLNTSPDPLAIPCAVVVNIDMDGGLIQDVRFDGPAPCEVIVRDYDVEGSDSDLERNEDGAEFVRSTYTNRDGDSELSIPSAGDLRKSRLADAGEDMLAALERSLFMLTSSTIPAFVNDGGTVDAVRAAIAKAKGESSDSEAIARAAGWSFDATEGAMMQAGTGSYFTCKTPDWDKAVNWSGKS